ncbi:MAG TPA: aldo/keto reductase [Acidimicrobiales bacterium]|nr:aldo/keto reductase [Acidimicrobiales bacterium]
MEFRAVGGSGLQVSVAGLGCNNFGMRIDADATDRVVHAALDLGVTLFDTADIYGGRGRSEELLGRALGARRDEVVLATKFGNPMGDGPYEHGASRRYVMQAVEASLHRLGTDRIDLYQLHVPDSATPIDETLEALADLVHAGKVRYVGSSNFTGWQVAEADGRARTLGVPRFVTAQNEWSLLRRGVEREVVPACEHFGVSVLPYFPLASGMLTGKYRRGEQPVEGTRLAAWGGGAGWTTDANFDKVEALEAVAAERGHTVGELALAWLAAQPVVCSVIAGATTPEQVAANVSGLEWQLDAGDLAAVDAALGPAPA